MTAGIVRHQVEVSHDTYSKTHCITHAHTVLILSRPFSVTRQPDTLKRLAFRVTVSRDREIAPATNLTFAFRQSHSQSAIPPAQCRARLEQNAPTLVDFDPPYATLHVYTYVQQYHMAYLFRNASNFSPGSLLIHSPLGPKVTPPFASLIHVCSMKKICRRRRRKRSKMSKKVR